MQIPEAAAERAWHTHGTLMANLRRPKRAGGLVVSKLSVDPVHRVNLAWGYASHARPIAAPALPPASPPHRMQTWMQLWRDQERQLCFGFPCTLAFFWPTSATTPSRPTAHSAGDM